MTIKPFNAQVGTASANSSVIDVTNLPLISSNLALQVVTSGFNTADATITVKHSLDGINFDTVADSAITLASGSASQTILMTSRMCDYYRIDFAKGTNSAGTFTVNLSFN